MPAPLLATPADAERFGYQPAPTRALLVRASARVRRHTRQHITPGTSTTTVHGVGPWRLPQRPAHALVAVTDPQGRTVAGAELRGSHLHCSRPGPLRVTYTHGYNPVPDELVELVAAIAARMAGQTGAGLAAGVRTEQAGAETVTWGGDAFAGTADLTTAEKAVLDRWFPKLPRTVRLL